MVSVLPDLWLGFEASASEAACIAPRSKSSFREYEDNLTLASMSPYFSDALLVGTEF